MKILFAYLALAATCTFTISAQEMADSIPMPSLIEFLNQRKDLYKRVESMRTVTSTDNLHPFVVIVSFPEKEGRIFTVLKAHKTNVQLMWRIKLPPEMEMSGANNLLAFSHAEDEIISLAGCARHECGGIDGIHGAAVYSLAKERGYLIMVRRCSDNHADRNVCVSPEKGTQSGHLHEISDVIEDLVKKEIVNDPRVKVRITGSK